MSTGDKVHSPAGAANATRKTATAKKTSSSSSSSTIRQTNKPHSSSTFTSASDATATTGSANKRAEKPLSSSSTVSRKSTKNKNVIDSNQQKSPQQQKQQQQRPIRAHTSRNARESSLLKRRLDSKGSTKDFNEESSSSSQEMTITSPPSDQCPGSQRCRSDEPAVLEQETNIDRSLDDHQATDDDESTTLLESTLCTSQVDDSRPALISQVSGDNLDGSSQHPDDTAGLPAGWEEHTDKEGVYYWHVPTGVIQRSRPSGDQLKRMSKNNEPIVLYHDDEEINQASIVRPSRTSSEEDEFTCESGAALTMADETTITDSISFVVYPLGCCEFDETQLISANSTKAIQKCILRLSNSQNIDECMCWGLDQTQPILMKLMDEYIHFTDISTQTLLRSQPIHAIKTWAVDDDNNFAFVVEDYPQIDGADSATNDNETSIDYALLTGPVFMCYVFSSMDDDDMSVKVAAKLNKEISRFREQMSNRISKSTRLQQMVDLNPLKSNTNNRLAPSALDNDQTDADEDLDDQNEGQMDDDDDLAESSEISLNVRYIGKCQVPRPMGIDVLNVAIDKCLADASKAQMNRLLNQSASTSQAPDQHLNEMGDRHELGATVPPLIDAKLHVSPSSVIVENEKTGEIIVECRIRYLTFMGISRRDIRWCGFIMQNTTSQTFIAHCFECYPTAGHVCEAIQLSCSRMYEKMVKRQRMKEQVDDATSIIPKSSKIRDTLAKTFSKIKLTPII
jgi:hypothetical protein